MKVAIHQPDLLPWPGFWFKMMNCDRFVLAVHDQLQKHWMQRRVMMRETWVSLPLVGKPRLIPLPEVEVKAGWQDHLASSIRGRYTGARHWSDRGEDLIERITAVDGTGLVDINVQLIRMLQDYLGIHTELMITDPPVSAGVDRVLEQLEMAGATSYLSGTGARNYIDDEAQSKFRDRGIELIWSDHEKTTGDSVVTVIMDYDDPLEIIARSRRPQ